MQADYSTTRRCYERTRVPRHLRLDLHASPERIPTPEAFSKHGVRLRQLQASIVCGGFLQDLQRLQLRMLRIRKVELHQAWALSGLGRILEEAL